MDLNAYLSHSETATTGYPNASYQQTTTGYGMPAAQGTPSGYAYVGGYGGTYNYQQAQQQQPQMQQQQPQAQQNLWSTPQTTYQQHPPSSQPAAMHGGRRFTGSVKSFSHTNGYGFVASQEIMDAFGRDIFINQIEVDKMTGLEKAPVSCGTLLSFTVVPNKRGQPQGRELQMENTMSQASLAQMAAMQAAQLGFGTTGVYNTAMMQGMQQKAAQNTTLGAMQAMGFSDFATMPTPDAQQMAALQKFTAEVSKFEEDSSRLMPAAVSPVANRDRSRSPLRNGK